MKGLKVFSGDLVMRREWRRTGLLRESMKKSELVVVQWVDHGRDGLRTV